MKERLNILHIDMDAFYAAVEELDNPSLKGKPVIVGGNSRSGIVTTANYEARKYGVHSAMPIFIAKNKCPHGIYVPVRKDRYSEVSEEVFKNMYELTELVEPVSVDEAYMDISNIKGDSVNIAKYIKKKIKDNVGLSMSIGISYNKFLAKLASDWEKPDGLTVITRDMLPDILLPLNITKIHGIGPKSAKRLNNIGIYNVKDLYSLSEEFLIDFFGKHGREIYLRIRGIDERSVNVVRERKSLGTERTFSPSTKDIKILRNYLEKFSIEVADGLKERKLYGRTVTVKIKFSDFKIQTKSKTFENDFNDFENIYYTSLLLLDEINIKQEVRLIGLTISNLTEFGIKQLSIF